MKFYPGQLLWWDDVGPPDAVAYVHTDAHGTEWVGVIELSESPSFRFFEYLADALRGSVSDRPKTAPYKAKR